MTNLHLSRRRLLQLGALSVVSPYVMRGDAVAQARSLNASTYHGLMEEAHRKYVVAPFQKATGAQATLLPMLSTEAVTRIVAQRDNPPLDVVLNDEGPFLATLEQDIYETINPSLVTNLKDIPDRFVHPSGKALFVSAQIIGLVYNPEKIRTPPTSWNDLQRPEFKGRIGITGPNSTVGVVWMVETAKLFGGSEKNLEPFFVQLEKILPNVGAVAPNPAQQIILFQQGQIDLSFSYLNLVMPLRARGVPIAITKPETGWVMFRNSMHVVKNTKVPDLAHAYINNYLGADIQASMAAPPYFMAPVNRNVEFGSELQVMAKNMSELEKTTTIDWAAINPQRAGLIERFNKMVRV